MSAGNVARTLVLLTTPTVLVVLVGRALGGSSGMWLALVLALITCFGAYRFSDRLALAMAGAKEVSHDEAPELHRLVERLAVQAKIPKPCVYMVATETPNAFATGRDPAHAAVAITTGLARILEREELAGVLVHELAHIGCGDTLVAALAATAAGAITMIAQGARWLLLLGGCRLGAADGVGRVAGSVRSTLMIFLAPIAAMPIQLAICRAREYGADATGARMLGNPLPLARALAKLEIANQGRPMPVSPAIAHQFTVHPLGGGLLAGLFNTHPPVEERVSRLREMALRPTSWYSADQ